jgi:hypothetical protein
MLKYWPVFCEEKYYSCLIFVALNIHPYDAYVRHKNPFIQLCINLFYSISTYSDVVSEYNF